MRVVHACWPAHVTAQSSGLVVWAEDSTLAPTAGRRGRRPRISPHPYAVEAAELVGILGVTHAATESVVLDLPTRGGSPLPSPELVREDEPRATGPVRPGRWRVPAVLLEVHQAYQWLSRLDPTATTYGASVHHLVELVAFAEDLVSRGRMLPMVLAEGPAAVWRPLLSGPDAAWARVLAAALPPALLATADDHEVMAGEVSQVEARDPLAVWAAAFDDLVDASVRAALGPARLSLGRRGTPTSRAWLAALTGATRTFRATSADLDALTTALARWQSDALAGPVRAFFRLTEPTADTEATPPAPAGDGGEHWWLRFGLQATDEQSLVAEAGEVWRATGALPGLGRVVNAPQETFLAELGKAARLYPALDDALRTARPDALSLDVAGAHRFLREAAPLLATAGFGVQLPGWWSKPATRLGVKVTATPRTQPGMVGTSAGIGLGAIADFRYDVAIGDDTLTADEVSALAELKSPLVRLRGQWVELDPRRLEAALRMAGRRGELTVAEVLRLGLGVDTADDDVAVTAVAADGWLGDLLAGRASERLAAVAAPAGFRGTLRPYQERGLSWLDFLGRLGTRRGAGRRHGPGQDRPAAGPAVDGPAGSLRRRARGRPDPAGLPDVAGRQLAAGGRALRPGPAGPRPPRRRARSRRGVRRRPSPAADLVITTYAHRRPRRRGRCAEIDVAAGRRRRGAGDQERGHQAGHGGPVDPCRRRGSPSPAPRWRTGSPICGRSWSSPTPGLLGQRARLPASVTPSRSSDTATTRPRTRLRRLTGPFVLRRLKTDTSIIADLPDKIEMKVVCNLTARAGVALPGGRRRHAGQDRRRRRDRAARSGAGHHDQAQAGLQPPGPAAARRHRRWPGARASWSGSRRSSTRCCRRRAGAGVHPVRGVRGDAARPPGRPLRPRGAVPARRRGRSRTATPWSTRFQADEAWAPPLFVLSLKAGGTGLNLTAANHVVHVDRWWNPAVEDQATDRAFRIGQRRDVQVRKFVCAGTVEEKIAAMISARSAAWPPGSSAPASAGSPSCPPTTLRELLRSSAGRWSSERALVPAVPADRSGRGRAQGAQHPGRHRRVVVVTPVHRRAGVVRRSAAGWPAGKTYARTGQVIVARGRRRAWSRAAVQGSRAAAVRRRDRRCAVDDRRGWARDRAGAGGAGAARAKLLAGEMPPEIEEVFAAAGAPLFPTAAGDLRSGLLLPGLGRAVQAPGGDRSTCWPRRSTPTRS